VLVLAEDAGAVVGVVRLCRVEDWVMLRGMDIQSAYRRQGLGTRMLRALEQHMHNSDCYCIPWAHLTIFYEQIGFRAVSGEALPGFLRERLDKHQLPLQDAEIQRLMQADLGVYPPDGLTFMVMYRPKG
jgi:predicted N-acetyltransferase YhbS